MIFPSAGRSTFATKFGIVAASQPPGRYVPAAYRSAASLSVQVAQRPKMMSETGKPDSARCAGAHHVTEVLAAAAFYAEDGRTSLVRHFCVYAACRGL